MRMGFLKVSNRAPVTTILNFGVARGIRIYPETFRHPLGASSSFTPGFLSLSVNLSNDRL